MFEQIKKLQNTHVFVVIPSGATNSQIQPFDVLLTNSSKIANVIFQAVELWLFLLTLLPNVSGTVVKNILSGGSVLVSGWQNTEETLL